ncbi:MAG: precorrin-8X methylmutase [Deltaproteobacteria bacterium]|nr:precorrin-8X methylmutase [Deltaproteobacteria bacterium]
MSFDQPTEPSDPKNRRPVIQDFLEAPCNGEEIEARSFAVIDREAPAHSFNPEEWEVVRRMIHTVGDFSIISDIRFSPGVLPAAREALSRGSLIYCDSNMIRSGLSLARLRRVHSGYGPEKIVCYVADEGVATEARETDLPRSLLGMRKARNLLNGAIAVFGNAPLALLELNRMILEEGLKPALVVGLPVGFVHVVESKEELLTLPVPHIVMSGRRGGSPLAVSVIHALCTLAQRRE